MDETEPTETEEFKWSVIQGDCLDVLKGCPPDFFDSLCTDPPAGVNFMGRNWDSDKGGRDQWIAWLEGVMREAMRCLKPGGHCLVWALPRTSHWTATALENAGFEIRDICHHLFGSGFPKSADISKAIDKLAGAEREVVATIPDRWAGKGNTYERASESPKESVNLTAPATDAAKQWEGFGTALKPAAEHWILARKPLAEKSIARQVLANGCGGLNIDGCRVHRAADDVPGWHKSGADGSKGYQPEPCHHCSGRGKARFYSDGEPYTDGPEIDCIFCSGTGMVKQAFAVRPTSPEEIQERCSGGRFPANLVLSHAPDCDIECIESCPVAELDRQSGTRKSPPMQPAKDGAAQPFATDRGWNDHSMTRGGQHAPVGYGDSGGASRFFPNFRYQAKPSRSEKEAGLDCLPERTLNRVNPGGIEADPRWAPVQVRNNHPTVKSIELMAWLIKLISPPNGIVLDPFAGSGSTGAAAVREGFRFVGIEENEAYCEIARARIQYWETKRP